MTAEHVRLDETREQKAPWKKWGPYLSERQWGTVREDYSEGGDAWNYFSHDQARSRAYRWGEDGLAGISADKQQLCFALALWNGKDSILKERLFGLTNSESNHGEDVKEYYFYLDSTPTHSYMKYLYKYPQAAFPYADLVETSRRRGRHEMEYELLDTGVFDQDRYFDVFVEYAKESPEDILIQITVCNRGPEPAELHVLPTLWFRNQWSWHTAPNRPTLFQANEITGQSVVKADELKLGQRYLYCEGKVPLLFTENETNTQRIFGVANRTPYVKDSINEYVVGGQAAAVNPEKKGTKVAAHYHLTVNPGPCEVIRLRLSDVAPTALAETNGEGPLGSHFDEVLETRRKEADEFYAAIIPRSLHADAANVMRQALAGMMWTKQFYHYDVDKWLEERGSDPFKATRKAAPRNDHWHHMYNGDIISMPDKWEYPWYAAWDMAFHVLALTMVDVDFGKQQLQLMLRERYLHPNGQIPAYEWNFGDVNPPVHAWSTIFIYRLEKARKGAGDTKWLKSCFQKLLLHFTWWVNRKDRSGRNVFEGGFLGLDNIGVFDRSAPLPTGGYGCDMAMLMLPDVFERTWGISSQPFWLRATHCVRERVPDFCFMAEVYWDMEWTLQQQGFDYTYDKRLYDRLREGRARPVREHFRAGSDYQSKMARFLENHDEPRAAAAFSPGMHEAAAAITFLSPGLRFFHQGQFEGRKKRISPHLGRGPCEPTNPMLRQFYERLLAVLREPVVRDGQWQLLECVPAWDGNWTSDCFVAFAWQGPGGERLLVAVNYAPNQSQCYLRLPFTDLGGSQWRLKDHMSSDSYDRDGNDLQSRGLFLDMPPWQTAVFSSRKVML